MSRDNDIPSRHMTSSELKYALKDVVDRAQKGHTTTITRFGSPVAVVVGLAEWERLKKMDAYTDRVMAWERTPRATTLTLTSQSSFQTPEGTLNAL